MNTFSTLTYFGVKPSVAEQIKTEEEMIQFFTHPRSCQSKTALYDQSASFQETTIKWIRRPPVIERREFNDFIVPLLINNEISLNTESCKRLAFAINQNPKSIENSYKLKKQIVERFNIIPQIERPYSLKESIFSNDKLQNLDQWKKSRDLLNIWNVIGELTLLDNPELNLDDIYKRMPSICYDFIVEKFEKWITENKDSLDTLLELDISNLQIDFLPKQLALFTNLTTLYISENNLSEIPSWIRHLSKLETLDLTQNRITHLPNEIGDLSQLKFLSVANNKIHELPTTMIDLCNLYYLDLSNNNLSEIPFTMECFHQLEYLILNNNKFSTLPKGLKKLNRISELYCMKNRIKKLPKTFASKNNIKLLNLSHNKIIYIPNWLSECSNLSWLYITHNDLQSIPKEIFDMDLEKMDLLPQNHACDLKELII